MPRSFLALKDRYGKSREMAEERKTATNSQSQHNECLRNSLIKDGATLTSKGVDIWRPINLTESHDKPNKATVVPYKSTTEPYKSTTEPYKSTTEPYKSTTEPYKSITEPYKETIGRNWSQRHGHFGCMESGCECFVMQSGCFCNHHYYYEHRKLLTDGILSPLEPRNLTTEFGHLGSRAYWMQFMSMSKWPGQVNIESQGDYHGMVPRKRRFGDTGDNTATIGGYVAGRKSHCAFDMVGETGATRFRRTWAEQETGDKRPKIAKQTGQKNQHDKSYTTVPPMDRDDELYGNTRNSNNKNDVYKSSMQEHVSNKRKAAMKQPTLRRHHDKSHATEMYMANGARSRENETNSEKADDLNEDPAPTQGQDRPYICQVCDKSFKRRSSLATHKFIHTDLKPHICVICNKKFLRKSDLKKHGLMHSGKKPYHCEKCGRQFSQSSNMLTHMRRHMGIRPFTCMTCARSFFRKVDLRRHEGRHLAKKMKTKATAK